MDTTCLYNQLLAGYLGGFHSVRESTDNDIPLFAVDPRYYVIRDVIVI